MDFKMQTLDIDTAYRISKYFFHKYKDFWNFRNCNFYTVNNGVCWCLKRDGVILSISRDFVTVWYRDYVERQHMEIYKVPDDLHNNTGKDQRT
jgi:hypothetical protein